MNDTIVVTSTLLNITELYGDGGNDDIFGGASRDYIKGGFGSDELYGHGGHDLLFGEAGNDSLFGGNQNDLLSGGTGNDRLHGNGATDVLFAGTGSDWLYGDHFGDLLIGNQTDFDNDENKMQNILNVWTNVSTTLDQKATLLRGTNFELALGKASKVDGFKDRYFGGNGLDMFADIASEDEINDFENGDLVFRA